MNETEHPPPEGAAERESAHGHADDLRRRVRSVAADIARTEEMLALVYEESARLRPHAADRLREGARHARDYAERERQFSADGDVS